MWTISEAFKKYITNEIICGGLSEKTKEGYEHTAKLVIEFLSDCQIYIVKIEDVQQFYQHLLGWQKQDTARLHLSQFRAVLRFCAKRKQTDILVDEIKVPKRSKSQIEYLTASEVEKFIEVIAQKRRGYAEINRLRNIAIVEVLWSSGIRIGELCSLNRDSIRDRQFVVVGKSKNPRLCFISDKAEKRLNEYLSARDDYSPALFIANETGNRIAPGGVRNIFRRACNQSDFENIHPHTIRHSFATFMLSREVDLRYIGAMMGHESLDTTKIYTHYTNPQLRKIYENAQKNP